MKNVFESLHEEATKLVLSVGVEPVTDFVKMEFVSGSDVRQVYTYNPNKEPEDENQIAKFYLVNEVCDLGVTIYVNFDDLKP